MDNQFEPFIATECLEIRQAIHQAFLAGKVQQQKALDLILNNKS
jgi:hypothetical protein